MFNCNETIEQSSDLGGNRFGFTADGQPGYKKAGADTVYPFKGFTIIKKAVTIGAGNAQTMSLNISEDFTDYAKLEAKDIFLKHIGGSLISINSSPGNNVGLGTLLSFTYNKNNGTITVTINSGYTNYIVAYWWRQSTYTFEICILSNN